MKKVLLMALLCTMSVAASAQIDIQVWKHDQYSNFGFLSMDTAIAEIDYQDTVSFGDAVITLKILNKSVIAAEDFYVEAEWLCSNSSAFYQFCQQYPPYYTSGTCFPFHTEGTRDYDDYHYSIPPDTCSYNYLLCEFKLHRYNVEVQHEKICKFTVRRRYTHEVLDTLYLIIRKGNLPCYKSQPGSSTGIANPSADFAVTTYPNPASNLLTIDAGQDRLKGYTLYAADGKRIMDQTVDKQKVQVYVADLSNGIYYLKLTGSNGTSSYKKIVVAH